MDPVHLGYRTHNMHSINPMGVVPHDLVPLSNHYTQLLSSNDCMHLHPCSYYYTCMLLCSVVPMPSLCVLPHDVLWWPRPPAGHPKILHSTTPYSKDTNHRLPTDVILLLMSSLLVIIITTTPQYRTVFSVGHCHKYYISTINDMITDNPLSYLTTVIRPSQKYLWVQMRIVKPSLNIYISIRYNQRDIYKYNSTASERLKEDCYYNIYKAF